MFSLYFLNGKFAKAVVVICCAFLLLFAIHLSTRSPSFPKLTLTSGSKCANCHPVKPDMLNVHLIPYTQDHAVFDSVIQDLLKDSNKRFIYDASTFFLKWWREQTPQVREQVKMLFDEGRLEFVSGARSSHSEATRNYQSVIDQFAWDLRRLNDTFGECGRPRIGWQIDSLGHSREMASMFAQMGYDGLFVGHLDYQDKDERLMTRSVEMIWRASANLGESSHIFTGALYRYNQYQSSYGPIVDGENNANNNVEQQIDNFLEFVTKISKSYRTNNLLVAMGQDLYFQDTNSWHENLDKLIKYSNERQTNDSNINLLYSTPSCYLKALHDAGKSWPTKDDNFLPYASDPHTYWSGYFTSDPTLKRYDRVVNQFLQVCKRLMALAPTKLVKVLPHLALKREKLDVGIMQLHDEVIGSEKEECVFDYAKCLSKELRGCSYNTREILKNLTTKEFDFEFKTCSLLNISSCDVSETKDVFMLTLYNPLSKKVTPYVRVPLPDTNFFVRDSSDATLRVQFVPIPESVEKLTFRNSSARYELIFYSYGIPAFGYRSFHIMTYDKNRSIEARNFTARLFPVAENLSNFTSIANEHLRLFFDTNGFLSAITADNITRAVKQEFLYYEAAEGNNKRFRNLSADADIFRPKSDTARPLTTGPKLTVYRGPLVEEVHQQFNDWISQVVRVYRGQRHAEFEWLIGPIPIEDNVGKEIITRFNSDIQSDGIFYTDSNGREMIKRSRDHRDTWKVKLLERTAGNYYPITTKIALEDAQARLAILTDRAQGGSSLKDGSLELMVHRCLLHDDAFAMDEAFNETADGKGLVARGTHYLMMGSSQLSQSPTTQAWERFVQHETLLPALKFFSNVSQLDYDEWRRSYRNIFTGLSVSLPPNVNVLTFEPWHDNEILIRFEHIFEKDEDPEFSKAVLLNLKDLLFGFKLRNIRETTLDGSAWLDDTRRLIFVPDPQRHHDSDFQLNRLRAQKLSKIKTNLGDLPFDDDEKRFIIELNPMQIRTFVLFLSDQF